MQYKNTSNLLKWVVGWNCLEDECSEEFLFELRGKMVFDLEIEFPLLNKISVDDMQFTRKNSDWEQKYYSITFSEAFISEIHTHYPEHLI
ncbi:MAG: hypothetical protein DRH57_01450 [Candidatus Cloacimonadota bacterium]|nr:MAG: hypothetical protein DRH57_01450 [Candidatus Cloacimonadota bacterium]